MKFYLSKLISLLFRNIGFDRQIFCAITRILSHPLSYSNLSIQLGIQTHQSLLQSSIQQMKKHFIDFGLKYRGKPFILDSFSHNPYHSFSFIQSAIRAIPFYAEQKQLDIPSVNKYTKTLLSYQYSLSQFQQKELTIEHFDDFLMKEVSKAFIETKEDLNNYLNIEADGQKICELAQLAYSLNILDLLFWNKILSFGSLKYHSMSLPIRLRFSEIVISYTKKYILINSKFPSLYKFVYKETCLSDLMDFQQYIIATNEPHFFKPEDGCEFGQRMAIFKNKMKIIDKVKKVVDVNFIQIRGNLKSYQKQIIDTLDLMNLNDMVEIHYLFSNISALSSDLSLFLQKNIEKKIKEEMENEEIHQKRNIIRKITKVWVNQGNFNPQIYSLIVGPLLQSFCNQEQEKISKSNYNYFKHLIYNLLAAGVPFNQEINQVIDILQKNNEALDKTLHIIGHLKKIRNNQSSQQLTVGELVECRKMMSHQKQAIQFNNVQKFWYDIIIDVLGWKSVMKSKYICVYEIDTMVAYKEFQFAIQILGSHYTRQVSSQAGDSLKERLSGKKKIKEQILKSFGLRIISIHCSQPNVRILMRLMDKEKAKIFIKNLLQEAYAKAKSQQKSSEQIKY